MMLEDAVNLFWGEGQGVLVCHDHPKSVKAVSLYPQTFLKWEDDRLAGWWRENVKGPLLLACSSSEKLFLHFNHGNELSSGLDNRLLTCFCLLHE